MRRVNNGFSLIELSVALVIMGGITLSLLKIFPQVGESLFTNEEGRETTSTLLATSDALVGFITAYNRLPCPDSGSDGLEDCAAAAQRGTIPYKTLHLANPVLNLSGNELEYAVYRNGNITLKEDADLVKLKNRYEPLLPDNELSGKSNGLDFCFALQQAIKLNSSTSNPYLGEGSSRFNMAFILADPGAKNADNLGGLFDQNNSYTGSDDLSYELATKPRDLTYDDRIYGMAFTELAGRLQCAQQLAEVNGAAREAFAANDMKDLSLYYQTYRSLALSLSKGNVDSAIFKLSMTGVDSLILLASTAITLALAAETANGVTVAVAIPAALAIAAQAASVVNSIIALTEALSELEKEKLLKSGADTRVAQLTIYAESTLNAAKNSDKKGLF